MSEGAAAVFLQSSLSACSTVQAKLTAESLHSCMVFPQFTFG